MADRKLASIQQIVDIQAIPDADKIERARVLGWDCVVKKGMFKIGDPVVYIEIDSMVPKTIWSGFLFKEEQKKERYRLKTVRMKGQISQGLIMPIDILRPEGSNLIEISEGQDVTELLGIVKYEPTIDGSLSGRIKGTFPSWIPKTDETRIQTEPRILEQMKGKRVYITEKVDGSSMTVYLNNGEFGVCSRNMDLFETENNSYWLCARNSDLERKLKKIAETSGIQNVAVQGELLGPKVNGNKYKLSDFKFLAFNLFNIDTHEYYSFQFFDAICSGNGITVVPVLQFEDLVGHGVDYWVEKSKGYSVINPDVPREGIVVRGLQEEIIYRYGRFSFKVINPEFLLKFGE